jgi:hypothetical protein
MTPVLLTTARLMAVATLLVTAVPLYAVAQSQPSDAVLVEALANGSPSERTAALDSIRGIPVRERGPMILPALIQELERLRQQLQERQFALQTGQPLPPAADHGEYLFNVIDLVAQHTDDVRIVSALLPFIGTGNRVINTLAGFGERAVQDVVLVASSPLSSPTDVHSSLLTLQRIVERHPPGALTASARKQIAQAAVDHLSGGHKDTVVVAAIGLAGASGDPQALQRVRALAADQGAVQRLGITDPAVVGNIQRQAASVLRARGLQ